MLDPRHFDKIIDLLERVNKNLPVDTVTKVLRPVDKDVDALNTSNIIDGYDERMLDYIKNKMKHRFNFDREVYDIPGNKLIWPLTMYFDGKSVEWQNVIVNQQHSFKGWKCSAGSRRFYIEPGGDIYPCSLIRGRSSNMGNIADQNFKLYGDYITCPVQWCPCKMDAIAEKVRVV
jgi:MoaA/NifB/PqqE/SkfB family radical SAM enzyme